MKTPIKCEVGNCTKNVRVRKFCRQHYQKFMRQGIIIPKPRLSKNERICTVSSCEKLSLAKGLCDKHYARLRNTGTTEERQRPTPKNGRYCVHGKHLATFLMEQFLRRPLLPNEIVHHKDENKLNDTLDNLQLMTRSEHSLLHQRQNREARGESDTIKRCPWCFTKQPREDFHGQPRCRPCNVFYAFRRKMGLNR